MRPAKTDLRGRARKSVQQAQVATHQLAGGRAGPVEGLGRGLQVDGFTKQSPTQRFQGHFAAGLPEQHRHHAVDAGIAQPQQVAVQHRDVGKAGNPLRLLLKTGKVQLVDDAGRAVAPAGAEDGPDAGVVELLLEVTAAQVVAARKLVVGLGNAFTQHHFQAPVGQHLQGRGQLFSGDFAGGADNGDPVAGLQRSREVNGHDKQKTELQITQSVICPNLWKFT
jgi:hypothetical protein